MSGSGGTSLLSFMGGILFLIAAIIVFTDGDGHGSHLLWLGIVCLAMAFLGFGNAAYYFYRSRHRPT